MKLKSLASHKIIFLSVLSISLTRCEVNNQQLNFKKQALSPPEGITEMTINGLPAENQTIDQSDWRTAPKFGGLVKVQTQAFPNPAHFDSNIMIVLYSPVTPEINSICVYVYRPVSGSLNLLYTESIKSGLQTIKILPRQFVKTGAVTGNLYRIVVTDGTRSIITYGDVKIR